MKRTGWVDQPRNHWLPDVCHLNLQQHIRHIRKRVVGGPGVGPICVAEQIGSVLPGNPIIKTEEDKAITAISAPLGKVSVPVFISLYWIIKMLGNNGF